MCSLEGHARFQELARRYAELTEQATWERQSPEIKKSSSGSLGLLPPNLRVLAESQRPIQHLSVDPFYPLILLPSAQILSKSPEPGPVWNYPNWASGGQDKKVD